VNANTAPSLPSAALVQCRTRTRSSPWAASGFDPFLTVVLWTWTLVQASNHLGQPALGLQGPPLVQAQAELGRVRGAEVELHERPGAAQGAAIVPIGSEAISLQPAGNVAGFVLEDSPLALAAGVLQVLARVPQDLVEVRVGGGQPVQALALGGLVDRLPDVLLPTWRPVRGRASRRRRSISRRVPRTCVRPSSTHAGRLRGRACRTGQGEGDFQAHRPRRHPAPAASGRWTHSPRSRRSPTPRPGRGPA